MADTAFSDLTTITSLGTADTVAVLDDTDSVVKQTTLGSLNTFVSTIAPMISFASAQLLGYMNVVIGNGTTGISIDVTITGTDTATETDLAKSGTSGDISLDAAGTVLTLDSVHFTNTITIPPMVVITRNASSQAGLLCFPSISTGDMLLTFYVEGEAGAMDLTTIADSGSLYLTIYYLKAAV